VGAVLGLFSAALVVAVLVGCGGNEGTAITKAEFIEKANAVCAKTKERVETEFAAYGDSGEAREAERAQRANELTVNEAAAKVAVKILIPAMRQEVEELRDLGVPSEGEGRAEALLDAFAEGIEKAEARPERAARDGTEAFGRSGRLAEEYGIENC
jgi:hypothetical protein